MPELATLDLRAEQAAHRQREEGRTLQRRAERVLQVAGRRASDEDVRTAADETYGRYLPETRESIVREALRLRDGTPRLAWMPPVPSEPEPASDPSPSIEVEKQEVAPAPAEPTPLAEATAVPPRPAPSTRQRTTPEQREEIRAWLRTWRSEHPGDGPSAARRAAEERFGLAMSEQAFRLTYWNKAVPGVESAPANPKTAGQKRPAAKKSVKPARAVTSSAPVSEVPENIPENIPEPAAPPPATTEPTRAPIAVTSQDGAHFRVELHLALECDWTELSGLLVMVRGAKGVDGER